MKRLARFAKRHDFETYLVCVLAAEIVIWLIAAPGCATATWDNGPGTAADADSDTDSDSDAGAYYWADAGMSMPECFSSNECPTGWTCSEFGTCVPPLPAVTDGGVAPPPEVQLTNE